MERQPHLRLRNGLRKQGDDEGILRFVEECAYSSALRPGLGRLL